jgi:hypothetical protein
MLRAVDTTAAPKRRAKLALSREIRLTDATMWSVLVCVRAFIHGADLPICGLDLQLIVTDPCD